MKYLRSLVLIVVALFSIQNMYSQQTVVLNIAKAIEIDAGNDVTIDHNSQVVLGGSPTAQFGIPPYIFSWTPVLGLDDPLSANPVATLDDTITYTLEVTDVNGCSLTDEITINVITIGMNEVESNYDILIYPNPNSGVIHIDFNELNGDIHILILDLNGKIIREKKLHLEDGSSYSFDLQNQPAGSYILQFKGKDFIITRSIIKK